MDELHDALVTHIRSLADKRGVQLTVLPDLAGVGRSHFWQVLAGRASPTLRWIGRLASALDVSVDVLLQVPRAARPRLLRARRGKRYEAELPMYSLQAAASAFSRAQSVDATGMVRVRSTQRDPARLFVGRVRGRSMEPTIPSGSLCLFRAAPVNAPDGKICLVELRHGADPETGGRYTVKRLMQRSRTLVLMPDNPRFARITVDAKDEDAVRVAAEWLDVLEEEA